MAQSRKAEANAAILDAADIAHAKATLAAVTSGEMETLTADEIDELLAAPTPLAFWRKKRGLTQSELAGKAGMSLDRLAEIENGACKGDSAHFKRLAQELNVAIENLAADD